jgi:hypothetical protein
MYIMNCVTRWADTRTAGTNQRSHQMRKLLLPTAAAALALVALDAAPAKAQVIITSGYYSQGYSGGYSPYSYGGPRVVIGSSGISIGSNGINFGTYPTYPAYSGYSGYGYGQSYGGGHNPYQGGMYSPYYGGVLPAYYGGGYSGYRGGYPGGWRR